MWGGGVAAVRQVGCLESTMLSHVKGAREVAASPCVCIMCGFKRVLRVFSPPAPRPSAHLFAFFSSSLLACSRLCCIMHEHRVTIDRRSKSSIFNNPPSHHYTMLLIESNRDCPYFKPCLHRGKHKSRGNATADQGNCPPPPIVVFLGKKRVTFESNHQIFEYDDGMTEEDKDLLWYDENDEAENCRIARDDSSDESQDCSPASICYNHTRRILLNYESYRGMENGSELLRNASRQSSQPSRNKAHKQAIDLSKVCSNPRDDIFLALGYDSRIADFYIESMMNMLMERNWLCAALLCVSE